MHHDYEATDMRRQWIVLLVLLVALLVLSAVPGYAQRGGHGGGHGGHGSGHGRHHFGHGGHGFVGPRFGVSIWPYWDPYWAPYWGPYWGSYWGPYSVPPVVAPSPQIYVQPAPPTWYYCDNPQGYYPYVQQCPGGWRPVTPTPP